VNCPKSVKIGTHLFDVVERLKEEDGMLNDSTLGYTLEAKTLIVIDKGLSESKKRQTLLHEIMHACVYVFDTSVKPKKTDEFDTWEHYFIGIWEEPLLMIMQDNPKLVEFLLGKSPK